SLKKGRGEIAASARQALRIVDELRERGSLSSGVTMESGGTMTVCLPENNSSPKFLDNGTEDDQIIKTALVITKKEAHDTERNPLPVILVSKDTAVRIKAESLGIPVEDYKNDKTSLFQEYGKVLSNGDNTNGILSQRYLLTENSLYKLTGKDRLKIIKRARQ